MPTVLLITSPAIAVWSQKPQLTVTNQTLIEVNPDIRDAKWLRQYAKKLLKQPIVGQPFPENGKLCFLFIFCLAPCLPVQQRISMATAYSKLYEIALYPGRHWRDVSRFLLSLFGWNLHICISARKPATVHGKSSLPITVEPIDNVWLRAIHWVYKLDDTWAQFNYNVGPLIRSLHWLVVLLIDVARFKRKMFMCGNW